MILLRWTKLPVTVDDYEYYLRDGSITLAGDRIYWANSKGHLKMLFTQTWRWGPLEIAGLGITGWHAAVLIDDKIYFFGQAGSESLVEYDIVDQSAWEVATVGKAPERKKYMTCVFAEWRNEIVTFGGQSQQNIYSLSNETYAFNVESKSWSKLLLRGEPPKARIGHDATILGSKMFVFGGYDSRLHLSDLWIAELERARSQFWSRVHINGRVPASGINVSLNNLNGLLVVMGGLSRLAETRQDVEVYFPDTSEWHGKDSLQTRVRGETPKNLSHHIALTIGSGIFSISRSGFYYLQQA